MKNPDRNIVARLEDLPNIGKSLAGRLHLVGINKPSDLIGENAVVLYKNLCVLTQERQDPCVLDTFISVIHFMEGGDPLPWWAFTAERKKKNVT